MKKIIKIMCALLALVCVCMSLASCVSAKRKAEISEVIANAESAAATDIGKYVNALEIRDFKKSDEVTNYVCFEVDSYGKIILALRPDIAPISVKNFQDLVASGFYDNTLFHRVIADFVVQGGGYNADFSAKPAENIKGEFSANGVENNIYHVRGVLSMARVSGDNDSGSSQFFIMHDTSLSLDGQYAAFGFVIAGISTVDKIASVQTNASDYPVTKVILKSAYFVSPKTN